MSRKIGFWSVFALVTGSQIGSGVFMLPAALAPYGFFSLLGWILSGCGAIALSLVFSWLCAHFPKTGGPHVYVKEAFGSTTSFFTGWTYWVVSWVSTTVVIIASIGYLVPLLGDFPKLGILALEMGLLAAITLLNLRGVNAAGSVEFFLTVLKVVPLIIIPLLALFFFQRTNFILYDSVAHLSFFQIISRVALLTLWGFIGLESATTPAGSVENPSKTIPRAVVAGTISVALLYLVNSIGIMGIIPGSELMHSSAPYADAARAVFGGSWHLIIAIIASVICVGTLNAWMLTSGQIALGLAQDRLMPVLFRCTNSSGAPFWGVVISSLGIAFLLVLTMSESLATQILTIIDFSVTAFLFIYSLCCLAFLKLLVQRKGSVSVMLCPLFYGLFALTFCLWVILQTPLQSILVASLFTASGIPIFLYIRVQQSR